VPGVEPHLVVPDADLRIADVAAGMIGFPAAASFATRNSARKGRKPEAGESETGQGMATCEDRGRAGLTTR
jgi:hypothetical protein